MNALTKVGGMLRKLRAKLTYANVLSTTAVLLSLMGGAYANHLLVLSSDIVDGEVKTADIASSAVTAVKLAGSAVTSTKLAANAVTSTKLAANAVTSTKLAANAVTSTKLAAGAVTGGKLAANAVNGAKVLDNSLTGADIDEQTLSGVNANTLDGKTRGELLGVFGFSTSEVVTLPACSNGLEYLAVSLGVGVPGVVLVNTSFTAGTGSTFSAPFGIAARVEITAPTSIVGEFQESHFGTGGSGRSNIANSEVLPVVAGLNTIILRVCDASDTSGGHTIRGQMTIVYRPN